MKPKNLDELLEIVNAPTGKVRVHSVSIGSAVVNTNLTSDVEAFYNTFTRETVRALLTELREAQDDLKFRRDMCEVRDRAFAKEIQTNKELTETVNARDAHIERMDKALAWCKSSIGNCKEPKGKEDGYCGDECACCTMIIKRILEGASYGD